MKQHENSLPPKHRATDMPKLPPTLRIMADDGGEELPQTIGSVSQTQVSTRRTLLLQVIEKALKIMGSLDDQGLKPASSGPSSP